MPADTDRLAFFLVASLMAALQATPAVGSDVTPKQLDAVIDSWRGAQDSLSDMGQEGSLRIQLAMERMSSFAATLSSMMKKMSETQAGIVANMK